MKINNFWGELTDIPAKKEPLMQDLELEKQRKAEAATELQAAQKRKHDADLSHAESAAARAMAFLKSARLQQSLAQSRAHNLDTPCTSVAPPGIDEVWCSAHLCFFLFELQSRLGHPENYQNNNM